VTLFDKLLCFSLHVYVNTHIIMYIVTHFRLKKYLLVPEVFLRQLKFTLQYCNHVRKGGLGGKESQILATRCG